LLFFEIDNVHCNKPVIQGVPGVKVNILGFNSRADAESIHMGPICNSSGVVRFCSTVNKLKRKEEHCAFIEI
jgi:hypothetical protein